MAHCPFLSSLEEKVLCFKECAFYQEGAREECPFLKTKEAKSLNIKDILSFDLNLSKELEDDLYKDLFIKEYLDV